MIIHDVEINFPKERHNISIKIDGKEFGPTSGIIIKSPLASGEAFPTVEIRFYARVTGKIQPELLKLIQLDGEEEK